MGNDQSFNQDQNFKNNERKGRGMFYGIIALAVFIIMAVGATFAYFTATTTGGSESVQAGSTTLQLKYISYGAGWMNRDLIPVEQGIAEYSFESQNDTTMRDTSLMNNALCKDDFGNSICSVYVFQVYNNANSPQTVSISVVTDSNSFTNLHSMGYELSLPTDSEALALYDVDAASHNGDLDPDFRTGSEDPESDTTNLIDVTDASGNVLNAGSNINANEYTPIFINRRGVVKTLLQYNDTNSALVPSVGIPLKVSGDDNMSAKIADNVVINGGEVKTFAIVLYINEIHDDQTDADAAMSFTGHVVVGSGDGNTGVTGVISAYNAGDLQSNQNSGSGSTTEPGSEPGTGTSDEPQSP